MQDRVSVNPGRVLITPEDGSTAFYATMTRADNPTQEGTPLNKASLLTDATAALLGGDSSMVPDKALQALKKLIDDGDAATLAAASKVETGSYTGTGSTPKNFALPFPARVLCIYHGRASDSATEFHYTVYFYGVPCCIYFRLRNGSVDKSQFNTITTFDGYNVYDTSSGYEITNRSGYLYNYWAIG